MMGNRGCRGGDEFEAFTRWRKMLGWQRDELRRLKRAFSKRMRRGVRLTLRSGLAE